MPRDRRYSKSAWQRTRKAILMRDGYTCQVRGPRCQHRATSVHHILPSSQYPHLFFDSTNLQASCGPCNYSGGRETQLANRSDRQMLNHYETATTLKSPPVGCKKTKGPQGPFVVKGPSSSVAPRDVGHTHSGRLTLLIDASYDPDGTARAANAAELKRARLTLEDLYRLLVGLLQAAVEVVMPAVFPRVLGVPAWERIGSVAYLNSSRAQPGASRPPPRLPRGLVAASAESGAEPPRSCCHRSAQRARISCCLGDDVVD